MRWFKRIFLFLAVNFLVLITISFLLKLFNISPYLSSYSMDYYSLFLFCLIWGFVGAFVSLLLSKKMAQWIMGVKIIDPNTTIAEYRFLLDTVVKLSKDAGLSSPPEFGIYNSSEINAFATGATKKRSLIAISSALLLRMDRNEVEAILAHEMTHISNGDMVTMTLLQGVINAFVMFLARALAFLISTMGRSKQQRGRNLLYYPMVFLFEIIFMLLGSIVVAYFSRQREFKADLGGALLTGKENMILALNSLKTAQNIVDKKAQQPAFQHMKISTPHKNKLIRFFASHPSLDERIQRLKEMA